MCWNTHVSAFLLISKACITGQPCKCRHTATLSIAHSKSHTIANAEPHTIADRSATHYVCTSVHFMCPEMYAKCCCIMLHICLACMSCLSVMTCALSSHCHSDSNNNHADHCDANHCSTDR